MLYCCNLAQALLELGRDNEAEQWLERGRETAPSEERLPQMLFEEPEVAVQIWGATAAALADAGRSLGEEPSDYAEKVASARRRLGEAEFARLWNDGSGFSRNDAVAYALSHLAAGP